MKYALILLVLLSSVQAGEPVWPIGVDKERLATELLWGPISAQPIGRRPRVIVVLGGGGARGLSHIGVLRVLEEERIPIDQIVGVSVGALIGSLYAAGLSINEIEQMARKIGWEQLTDFSKASMVRLVFSETLLSNKKMETYLEQHIGNKNFSDLKIPFTCLATDLRSGERIVFNQGSVAFAARASATIPGIFSPVEYNDRELVDGGLIDNLPTDTVQIDENDFILAVQPIAELHVAKADNVFKTLVRSIEIQKDELIKEKKKKADFLIEPNVGIMSIVDIKRSEECMEAGIAATQQQVLELKKMLIARSAKLGKP